MFPWLRWCLRHLRTVWTATTWQNAIDKVDCNLISFSWPVDEFCISFYAYQFPALLAMDARFTIHLYIGLLEAARAFFEPSLEHLLKFLPIAQVWIGNHRLWFYSIFPSHFCHRKAEFQTIWRTQELRRSSCHRSSRSYCLPGFQEQWNQLFHSRFTNWFSFYLSSTCSFQNQ